MEDEVKMSAHQVNMGDDSSEIAYYSMHSIT